MSSFFFFIQDQPKSDNLRYQVQLDLHEKLKEISCQIKRDGVSIPDVLRSLTKDTITQCVIGPSHIAFLLQDGRVCRVTYTIQGDKLSTKSDRKRKQASSRADSPTTSRDGSSGRSNSQQFGSRSYRSSLSAISRASRGLNFLREMQRQGIYVARSVAHQIHASEVPEILIEECQTVLQGKSRQVIIRELQNTNLDVNMAVNNLLSRDDEVEQGNGAGSGDGGLGSGPGSDDWDGETMEFLSFFEYPDSHILFESDCAMTDELIEPPTSPRLRNDSDHGYLSDRRKRRRMESHLLNRNTDVYTGRSSGTNDLTVNRSSNSDSLINLGSLLDSSTTIGDGTKQSTTTSGTGRQYVQLGDTLEFWSDPENSDIHLRFVHISALHSELVAITAWGELHQWRWSERIPFYLPAGSQSSNSKDSSARRVSGDFDSTNAGDSSLGPLYHPRIVELGLVNEKIIKLSGCATRATVQTASGKFATWMDESLIQSLPSSAYQSGSPPGPLSIEHQAIWFQELKDETVVDLQTAPLITTVRCLSGAIYWWGIHPSYMRQRTIERSRQHRLSSFSSRRSNHNSKSSSERPIHNRSTGPDSVNNSSTERLPNWSDIPASQTTIVPGSFVCIKSAPIFHAGAIGFSVVSGVPKVGTLLEDAWKITDVCRFRIQSTNPSSFGATNSEGSLHSTAPTTDVTQHSLTCPHALAFGSNTPIPGNFAQSGTSQYCPNEQSSYSICTGGPSSSLTFQEMPPPPSPASSTCSDQSGPVRVSPGTFKRMKVPSISGERSDRLVSEWDIGSQPSSGRSARGRSADRETGTTTTSSVTINLGSKRSFCEVGQESLDSKLDGISGRFGSTNEEDWCLNDVVFVEDGRTQPVGIVLKVDGNIAAVKFLREQERICLAANCAYSPVCNLINNILGSSANQSLVGSNNGSQPVFGTTTDPMSWLNDCRLLRKEDLTVVRSAGSVRVPDVVQRTPKRIFSFSTCGTNRNSGSSEAKSNKPKSVGKLSKIIAMATENCRIHVVIEEDDQHPAIYQVYNLSGKLITNMRLPVLPAALCASSDVDGFCSTPKLTCSSEPPLLLQDSGGLVFPFIPPSRTGNHETWIMPPAIDLPPVNCSAFSWFRNTHITPQQTGGSNGRHPNKSRSDQQPKSLFGVVVVKDLSLMPHILRSNDSQVERLLSSESEISESKSIKLSREMVDGQRNLLHMAVMMCAPQSNKETSPEWSAKLDPILVSPTLSSRTPNSTKSHQQSNEYSTTKPASTTPAASGRNSTYWSYAPPTSGESSGLSMHDLFIRSSMDNANSIASNFSRAEDLRVTTQTSGSGINFWHLPPVRKDDLTQRVASFNIVRLIVESPHLSSYLPHLLNARTTENLTPFMLAIKHRAYHVARFLYETIQCLAKLLMDDSSQSITDYYNLTPTSRLDFFYPLPSRPDDSPLFQLCYNDTCSFTWTGPDHIRQDIFECRTCGLMDSLCCCTECARVCHKGHDCRLKSTSPTAYCDCWEKCTCQSLVAGAQSSRHQIFYHLLRETNLIHTRNSRGEHLLLYLAKCVERQFREHRQHRPPRRRLTNLPTRSTSSTATPVTSAQSNAASMDTNVAQSSSPEEPDHDLDPPRFARDAFELTLDCPTAVCSLLNMDTTPTVPSSLSDGRKVFPFEEELTLMSSQGATNHLDDFVFTLICKCPPELIDILLATLNRCLYSETSKYGQAETSTTRRNYLPQLNLEPPSEPTADEVRPAVARLVRSTARLYTSLFLELSPDHKRSRLLGSQPSPIDICRHILSSLAPIAIAELPPLAAGLLAPIRMGTLRPCVPYKLVSQYSDAVLGLEQLINSERASLTRQQLLASVDLPQPMTNEMVNINTLRGFSGTDNRNKRGTTERSSTYADEQTTPNENFSNTTSEATVVATLPDESHPMDSNPDSDNIAMDQQRETPFEHETHSDMATNASSPFGTMTSSIHNPSLLTLQMQSTISDIETGIPESQTNNTNVENRNFDVSFSYSHHGDPVGSEDVENDGDVEDDDDDNAQVRTRAPFEQISPSSFHVNNNNNNREAGLSDDEDTAECRATPNTLTFANTTTSEAVLHPDTNQTKDEQQDHPATDDPNNTEEERHSNIDPFSSLDRDASDGQASDYDEYDDLNDVEERDDEDDENDTDDDDAEQDGYAIEEELVDGEDDDEDEDEDDSSHQSDASSVDAGSRSTSPTWVPCPRTSVFSRLSSRNTLPYSRSTTESTVTSSNPTVTSTTIRNSSDELNQQPSTNPTPGGTISTSTGRGGHNNLNLGRRAVQSVISLLSTSAPLTSSPTSVVNANESNTPTAVTSTDTNMRTISVLNQQGSASVLATQVYLCRAFGCLLRITADLMQEMREDMVCFGGSIRRSASLPTNMFSAVSIYDQQRRLPVYASLSTSSSGTIPPTTNPAISYAPNLLLPSMSTSSLFSATGLSDYRSIPPARPRLCPSISNLAPQTSGSTLPNINQMHSVSQEISQTKLAEMCAFIGVALIPVWQWLTSAMDNLEAQLRYSSAWDVCISQRNSSRSHSESDNYNGSSRDQSTNANDSNLRRGYTTNSSVPSRRLGSTGVTLPNSTSRLAEPERTSETLTDAPVTVLGQRQDFLAYLFSLMRASGNDHGDSVPFIDVPSYKHIAYVLDALLYFFRIYESVWPSGLTHYLNTSTLSEPASTRAVDEDHEYSILQKPAVIPTVDIDPNSQSPSEKSDNSLTKPFTARTAQRGDSFFRRSESILSLSGIGRDLLETPIGESLPLAVRPQLLHPDSRRTELFGSSRYLGDDATSKSLQNKLPNDQVPININAPSSTWGERMCESKSFNRTDKTVEQDSDKNVLHHPQLGTGGSFLDSIAHSATLLSRWCLSLEFFGKHFTNDVGAEYGSYILELGGFSVKEARFRKQMERLRNASRRDLTLEVERDRNQLLVGTVNQLNAEYASRQSHLPSGSVTTPTSLSRLSSSGYSYLGDQQRDSNASRSNNSPVAVALLLGTMYESPLLGTFFNSSPAATTSSLNKPSSNQPPVLTCRRLKVMFKDEPGEGSGVARSFFTAFCEAVLSHETLPQLNLFIQPTPTSASSNPVSPHFQHYTTSSRTPGSSSLPRSTLTPCSTSLFIPSSSNPATTQTSVTSSSRNIQSTTSPNANSIPMPYAHHYRLQPLGSCARARTSAWRRAGRLSVSAAPFCPTSSSLSSRAASRSPTHTPNRTSSSTLQSYSVVASLVPRTAETYPNSDTDNQTTDSATKPTDETADNSTRSTGSAPTSDPSTVRPFLSQMLSNSSLQSVGNQLYNRVLPLARTEQMTARITGMLLELPSSERSVLLLNDEALQNRVDEARALLTMADSNDEQSEEEHARCPSTTLRSQPILERLVTWRGIPTDSPMSSEPAVIPTAKPPTLEGPSSSATSSVPSLPEDPDRVPLFWQPGLQGYYFPRAVPGLNTTPPSPIDLTKLAARYSIYRCIGRVIGLCLLTNETCPLNFSRPVLKYILGRVLHWHDFAFYDPATFEGLRQLLLHTSPNSNLTGTIADYNLTFSLIVAPEEGGVSRNSKTNRNAVSTHMLVPNGDNIDVTETNVYEFVKRYTEFKMLECVRDSLEQIRQGVFDVLPRKALNGLTAEDLRLLLNGAGEIDADVLASYTFFTDESGISSINPNDNGAVARLKKWFWSTVRSMDTRQRMDLLHFWTSSPTLPASAQGFQPKPSITIRPPDNNYLPTANTCISRLYLPLYSSKQILREKLLQAIATKSFGFV